MPKSTANRVSLGRLVLDPLPPKAASIGKSVTFLCALAEGRTGKFTWTKDGILLHEHDRVQVANLRRTSTLSIDDVETSDRGMYTCTVSDADSEDRQSTLLSVEGNKKFKNDGKLMYILIFVTHLGQLSMQSCRVIHRTVEDTAGLVLSSRRTNRRCTT